MKMIETKLFRFLILGVLFLNSVVQTPSASANSLDSCRIKAAENQTVSLGFPVSAERLVSISKPRILVLPLQLKDHPNFIFSQQDNQDYIEAAKNISSLSSGKASVEIVIGPTIKTEFSIDTMNTLKMNQMIGYQNKDESISTYGFVRRLIASVDPSIDFKGFDAVIFDGSIRQMSSASDIAEAFMFKVNPQNTFERPILTNEGVLSNVILLSNHNTVATITHEILHLFGLIDLYGTSTGPNELSLMASNEITLTSYEKWVLGWLSDSDVQCFENSSSSIISEFRFSAAKADQLLVIPDRSGSHLIIETSKVRGQRRLAFFSLNNLKRPPMEFFTPQKLSNNGRIGLGIDDYSSIGELIVSPKYTLLVSDINQENLTFKLAPDILTNSDQFSESKKQAAEKRLLAQLKDRQIADAKSAAESRARQEAEAKAAEELKARQEAEAKATAELKARQEAEAQAASDAKVAAELKAKQEAAFKASATKKTTITCVKGTLTKKVTAVKPKCPAGYKVKK